MNTAAIRIWVTSFILCLSLLGWSHGLLQSKIWDPQVRETRLSLATMSKGRGTDLNLEGQLARAYWLRYEDVRADPFFGENGPGGISGARQHYQLYGRHEGRIFGPLPPPEDPAREKLLAEAYWNRYNDVADSPVWGRSSALGILGPRDHYHHIGRRQSRVWGEAARQ